MASGKKHDRASIRLAIPSFMFISGYAYWYSFDIQFVFLAVISYIFGAIFLNPDIDLFDSHPSNRWFIFKYLWIPYQKISGHRDHSFLKTVKRLSFSHFPLIGTVTRLGYLFFLLYLLHLLYCRVYYLTPLSIVEAYTLIQLYQLPIFLGAEIASLIHLCYDFVHPLNKG